MRITAATPRGLNIDALTDGMNDIDARQTQWPHATEREDVVLITHADTDRGYRLACRLLARGVRVVAVARHTSSLTRIMHGHSTFNVMAIAADVEDESQFAAVLARAESRLGHVTTIVDGRGSIGGGDLRNALDASAEPRIRYLRPA
jgi:NADP-dependent 3-hydroxy acid dehydrogenase YdfG